MKLCFATNNLHKLEEVRFKLGNQYELISLNDIGYTGELPENQKTLEGNSLEKAQYVYNRYRINCFADDTGLIVKALKGAPGVLSARYAGPGKDSLDNIKLLLDELADKTDRTALFTTIVTLILDGEVHQFEGSIQGTITKALKGNTGFGYDPVFLPKGYDKTFAEMSLSKKNEISHRTRAVNKLVNFLTQKET